MIDLIKHNMAPLMFGGLVVFLIIGYPGGFFARSGRIVFRLHWN